MLNPCLYKAFCIVLFILPANVTVVAGPLSGQRVQELTREQYIAHYKNIAIKQMHRYGIPASIILAQGCLESGNGNSRLAVEANNHFGIKCHEWEGDRIYHDDDSAGECFRKYPTPEDSYYDHSDFLSTRPRYAGLFQLDPADYKGWAYGLKEAGYATNPRYAQLLIDLIEKNRLYLYDSYPVAEAGEEPVVTGDRLEQLILPKDDDVFAISLERRIRLTNGKKYILAAPGDTYRSLAAEYRLFRGEITRFNDVSRNAGLAVGEKVYLERKAGKGPELTTTWTSREGETWHDVSQRFGIRLGSLHSMNAGIEGELIPGTVLRLR
ncbi:MAG TPA: glucosaminidase domain-containing protein [Bacteroidales bacterium]|nr:glucosaminidase domain-containing protein [Bacteroidales bacterium]HRW94339.1 glucosaminidase domain-containing protein [Bacteroidales bacterium]